jgi:transglutaminase-like putative cysteine protease
MEWLAALFLFLLIREWLLPLAALTDTADLSPFYLVTAGVLLLDLLLKRRVLAAVLKLAGVIWLVHASFFQDSILHLQWIKQTYIHLKQDIPLALGQNWLEMSLVSRNLLFDLLLAALASLLFYLVVEQRQGLWFVFLTEVYLATLDTFVPYEASGGIIRTLIFGFLLLAVNHLLAMERLTTGRAKSRFALWKSLFVPMVIILFSVGVAYAAPKHAPSWPDPVAFLQGKQSAGGSTAVMKKVGYDDDDENLGGPFAQDDRMVFRAIVGDKFYWRGDSKDIYTGKGWEKSDVVYEAIAEPRTHKWEEEMFKGLDTEKVTASLNFSELEKLPLIFYPGQLRQILAYTPSNAAIVYDRKSNHLETIRGEDLLRGSRLADPKRRASGTQELHVSPVNLVSYKLVAEAPVISVKKLTEAGTNYSEEIRRSYLQLPNELPARVKELAETITKDAKTPYDKVRAIESYLRTGGRFRYETKDVPTPGPDQDFVDQFLFESHRGYCDHFSTAMTVMLRSVGVPARWVKGFAPGTEIGETEDHQKIIEVRSKDAHSWVEVYFPQYGWIPFEATTSFVSPVRVNYDLPIETQPDSVLPVAQQDKPKDQKDRTRNEREGDKESGSAGIHLFKGMLAAAGGIIAAVLLAAWISRRYLLIWWLKRQMSAYQEDHFHKKYEKLLYMCERILFPRKPAETLREYVQRLSLSGDKRQDLLYLTKLYEKVCYGYKEIGAKARETANKIVERLASQLKP